MCSDTQILNYHGRVSSSIIFQFKKKIGCKTFGTTLLFKLKVGHCWSHNSCIAFSESCSFFPQQVPFCTLNSAKIGVSHMQETNACLAATGKICVALNMLSAASLPHRFQRPQCTRSTEAHNSCAHTSYYYWLSIYTGKFYSFFLNLSKTDIVIEIALNF